MTRVALAPCSPFSVTEQLMVRTAELAEQLDVRLHTHFAENAEDDEFSLATFGCRPMEYLERTGWCTDRTWVAHCVMPDDDEIRRLGAPVSVSPTARRAT
jgi:cytosine/adenosine deaminase-related metal-dependent hydrolase